MTMANDCKHVIYMQYPQNQISALISGDIDKSHFALVDSSTLVCQLADAFIQSKLQKCFLLCYFPSILDWGS